MSAAGARGGDTTGIGTAGATWRTSAKIVAGIVGADVGASHAAHAVDGNVRVVNKLGLGYFRSRLVEHFDIVWKRHEVRWPSRRARPSHLDI